MATQSLLTPFTPKVILDGDVNTKTSFLEGTRITGNASKSVFKDADYIEGRYNFSDAHLGFIYFISEKAHEEWEETYGENVPYYFSNLGTNITKVELPGYDSSKTAYENTPYVALRFYSAYPGLTFSMYPTNYSIVYSDTPRAYSYDYQLEAWGHYDFALLLSFLPNMSSTGACPLYIIKLSDNSTVICNGYPFYVNSDGTAPSTVFITGKLNIDWSQWHNIKLTWDYERERTFNGEVIYSRSTCKVRLYIDDVFIPFIQGGVGSDVETGTDSAGVWNDGSMYPGSTYTGSLNYTSLPYRIIGGFTLKSDTPAYNGTFLIKDVRLTEYIGKDSEDNLYNWGVIYQSPWTPEDVSAESEIDSVVVKSNLSSVSNPQSQSTGTSPNASVYVATVCNAWGSTGVKYIPVFVSPQPETKLSYSINGGEQTEVTQDTTVIVNNGDTISFDSAGSSAGTVPELNSTMYYPFTEDTTTNSGVTSITTAHNGFYDNAAVSFSGEWMILTEFRSKVSTTPSFFSGVCKSYRLTSAEFFIRITDTDIANMLDCGIDPAETYRRWIPVLTFWGRNTSPYHDFVALCYNPTIDAWALCLLNGKDFAWKQTYFVYPREREINHIAFVERPVVNSSSQNYGTRTQFLYINGVLVYKGRGSFISYQSSEFYLFPNNSNVNPYYIPFWGAIRTFRYSEMMAYPSGFDLKAFKDTEDYSDEYYCFNTGEDYEDNWYYDMHSDTYNDRVQNARDNYRYFDPFTMYSDMKLPAKPINPLTMYRNWSLVRNDTETDLGSDVSVSRSVFSGDKVTLSVSNDFLSPKTLSVNFVAPPTAIITTDTLIVYKGSYVKFSGEDSFSDITGYLWSNGSTSSEIVLLIDHTQNISLTVTNAYGSDTTTVTIICKDTPIIDKSPDLITVTTNALEVPISAIPYQELYIILNNQNCYITLRQLGDYIYATLRVDNNVIFSNVICNINAPLNVYPSPYFTGILQFYDEKGTDKPHYSELGSRWKLKYRESRLPGEVY